MFRDGSRFEFEACSTLKVLLERLRSCREHCQLLAHPSENIVPSVEGLTMAGGGYLRKNSHHIRVSPELADGSRHVSFAGQWVNEGYEQEGNLMFLLERMINAVLDALATHKMDEPCFS